MPAGPALQWRRAQQIPETGQIEATVTSNKIVSSAGGRTFDDSVHRHGATTVRYLLLCFAAHKSNHVIDPDDSCIVKYRTL